MPPMPFANLGALVRDGAARALRAMPRGPRDFVGLQANRVLSLTGTLPESSENFASVAALVEARCVATARSLTADPLAAPEPRAWPAVDLSVVTHDSARWVQKFAASVLALEYPRDRLSLRLVDHASSDGTVEALEAAAVGLRSAGLAVEVIRRPNRGFGAGHNVGLAGRRAPLCLVTNIDLTFEPDALARVVAVAAADGADTAAWELRQKPFEHPKFYDPVTGATNWNSHACVLLRRAAFEAVGGYDETLFMYGEDVELSYRLRRAGHVLRYCPRAVVWHHAYQQAGEVKPLQYTGGTFANLYLRLKYGTTLDALAVVPMSARLLAGREPFAGARREVARHLFRLAGALPRALAQRRPSGAHFPFRSWDYELTRDGAFHPLRGLPAAPPRITVITRTYAGRATYLRQALLSVAHQTWPNLEHLVVEDGGETQRAVVEEVGRVTGQPARFIGIPRAGRSAAGNEGLRQAKGRWCLFLDDDDLLFADHLEVLAAALRVDRAAVAAYALAWDVVTDDAGLAGGRYLEVHHGVPAVLRQPFDFKVLRHHNFMAIQSVLFSRQLFLERGGFDERMDALEDWHLWVRYAKGNRFAWVPRLTSMYRTPADPAKVKRRQAMLDAAYPAAVRAADAALRKLGPARGGPRGKARSRGR